MESKSVGGPLAQRLRQATKADHRRVDHHPALAVLLSPHLDSARFGSGLAALYPALAGLEHTLHRSMMEGEERYALTLREPLLRDDLLRLERPVPLPWSFTAPATAYDRVGMLYVLEGSRLGGHFIGRHAQCLLGEQVPCRFFTERPLTPHAWAAFWRYAEARCPEPTWPDVEQGARRAFREFIQALSATRPDGTSVAPTPAPIK